VTETEGSKNLAENETTRQEQAAGATKHDPATIKGKLIELAFWLSNQGYDETTVKLRPFHLKRLAELGADLWNPESVKEVLAKQPWGQGYKHNIVYSYESFLKKNGLTWERPKYKKPESLPFIPTETELDQLIASSGKQLGTFLQGLKDTGADPGELDQLKWIDINKQTRTVNLSSPVKGHNPRILTVSAEFINRLETLTKRDSEYIFNRISLNSAIFQKRKQAALKFANPRLKKISFITFRHWKGTMEYHRTKDIMHVKKLLGHKYVQNTQIYINLESAIFQTPNDEFTTRVAQNVREACELIEVGFEYVTGEYDDGGKIFRKRK
jgi:integrase